METVREGAMEKFTYFFCGTIVIQLANMGDLMGIYPVNIGWHSQICLKFVMIWPHNCMFFLRNHNKLCGPSGFESWEAEIYPSPCLLAPGAPPYRPSRSKRSSRSPPPKKGCWSFLMRVNK